VDAFNMKTIRDTVKKALDSGQLSVVIVRGACAMLAPRKEAQVIATDKCHNCDVCLRLGCPAIQRANGEMLIEATLCNGCSDCAQICPWKAIDPQSEKRD